MSDDINTLDLNSMQRDKEKSRFSFKKVEKNFENEDINLWASAIKTVQQGNFQYPAQKDLAIIHQQSCYLCPDDDFLVENPKLEECTCCGRKIQRNRVNYWTGNLYEILGPTEGLVLPLYFTFLKTHFFLLLLIQFLFGFYFMYFSQEFCFEYFNQDENKNQEIQDIIDYFGPPCGNKYLFIPQDFMLNYLQQKDEYYEIYLGLAMLVYTIIMITPFIHEIILRQKQIKYQEYDTANNIRFDKVALYIKHLPYKMSGQEIQQNIYQIIQKKDPNSRYLKLFDQNMQPIDELVYIYDTHILVELNTKRQKIFLELLKTIKKISDLAQEQELQEQQTSQQETTQIETTQVKEQKKKFKEGVLELMILTKQINIYLQHGLPFTKKIILKLKTEEQAQAVYQFFKRGVFNQIYLKAQVLWDARNEIQEEAKLEVDLNERLMSSQMSDSSTISKAGSVQDLANEFYRSKSMSNHQNNDIAGPNLNFEPIQNNKQTSSKSFVQQNNSFMEYMDKNEQVSLKATQRIKQIEEFQIKQLMEEEKKSLHIQRGFREDDIFWENIGMHTLRRFLLRLVSLSISILASFICMGLFQYLFIWSKHEQYKIQKQSKTVSLQENVLNKNINIFKKIALNLVPLVIVILSVVASVIVQITTIKARRSTYTQQEMNIINFISFSQLLLILSTPYILVISFWQGLIQTVSIETLILLGRIRIAFKGIAHIFHVRSCSFYCRRRKILKNFDGNNYFQNQLNQLLTPGLFPIRSRLLYAFFILSTGYLMIFLAPYLVIFCLFFQIFFLIFDRYALFRVYTVDKQFTFKLMRYLITAYQILMTPIYAYIFYSIFRKRDRIHDKNYPYKDGPFNIIDVTYPQIFGIVLATITFFSYILYREQIADFFIFKILRNKKPEKYTRTKFEKTYYDSYQQYYQKQGIEELTSTLVDIFHSLQQKKRDKK